MWAPVQKGLSALVSELVTAGVSACVPRCMLCMRWSAYRACLTHLPRIHPLCCPAQGAQLYGAFQAGLPPYQAAARPPLLARMNKEYAAAQRGHQEVSCHTDSCACCGGTCWCLEAVPAGTVHFSQMPGVTAVASD